MKGKKLDEYTMWTLEAYPHEYHFEIILDKTLVDFTVFNTTKFYLTNGSMILMMKSLKNKSRTIMMFLLALYIQVNAAFVKRYIY